MIVVFFLRHGRFSLESGKYYAKTELQLAIAASHAQSLNYSLQSPDLRHCCIVTLSNYPRDKSDHAYSIGGLLLEIHSVISNNPSGYALGIIRYHFVYLR